ncbi:MAG: hypothetical protein GWO02_07655, partial [Gammaproteobacteria bacterium]|nr:hypothetical protein [Gammaproteobacteria bacterium]
IGALLVSGQHRFSKGRFEWGSPRELTGIARERPQPMLLVPRPGGGVSPYLVVAVGKFGGAVQLAGLDGETVRLTGTLFYRDGQTLIEIEDGSVEPVAQSAEGELLAERS